MSSYGYYSYGRGVSSPPASSSTYSSGSTSYRSPYERTYSSNYTTPTYQEKFDSLISRNVDGVAKSRAGLSTKYDYLCNYKSSKYDAPSPSSTYTSTAAKSSLYDADDLTKSYFEKYYSKKTTTTPSTISDRSSAIGESGYVSRRSSLVPDTSRVSVARDTRVSVARDTDYGSRFRATSMLRDEKEESSFDKRRNSVSDLGDSLDSLASRYRRFSTIDSSPSLSTRKSDNAPPSCSSSGLGVNHDNDTGDTRTSSLTSRYRRLSISRSEDDDKTTKGNEESYSSTLDRRGSMQTSTTKDHEDSYSSTLDRRGSMRTYGGRSSTGESERGSTGPTTSRFQSYNGHKEDNAPTTCSTTDGNNSSPLTGNNGLRNIGNTCFMNSVLQCLSNTKPLQEYMMQDNYSKDINTTTSSQKGSLVKAYASLIKNLWKGSGRTVDPSSLKGAIQRYAPRFSGYNQEDSQEFLRYLLEGLHEDVNRVTAKPTPINTEIDSSLSVNEQAMEAWRRYLRREDSQLVDLFVGQLKSTLRCSQCGYESVTFEAFWDISLPIPGRTDCTLRDCFDAFTKEEVMDGDEMPTCERCKARRKCTKWYRIYKFPKILVIHLKRFSPNERQRSKLSAVVDFPLQYLDLGNYTDSATRSSFNCYAVSNHTGTLYSGHYTATAKNPHNGNWYHFDDSRVSKSSSSSVISNQAYLLFFELV